MHKAVAALPGTPGSPKALEDWNLNPLSERLLAIRARLHASLEQCRRVRVGLPHQASHAGARLAGLAGSADPHASAIKDEDATGVAQVSQKSPINDKRALLKSFTDACRCVQPLKIWRWYQKIVEGYVLR